jgi:hypothetical protein
MNSIDGIDILKKHDQIIIRIEPLKQELLPTVTILNHSGEVLQKFRLEFEVTLDLEAYNGKNCSIRITNGKNVMVQKI